MPKEGKTASARKKYLEARKGWLVELDDLLDTLQFGHIVINVYRAEITGISIARDVIRQPRRVARAKPPMPAVGE
jgi:hypothetical protein